MSRYNHNHKVTPRGLLIRIFGIAACVAILVISMPSGALGTYDYTLGQPWESAPIIATDSFPIYKSESTLQQERDSLKRLYTPYFQIDPQIEASQLTLMRKKLTEEESPLLPHFPLVAARLRSVYSKGIMPMPELDRFQHEGIDQICLYSQNESATVPFQSVFSEKTAYEFMIALADSSKLTRQQLVEADFQRFLKPNLAYDSQKSQQQRQEVDAMLVPFMGQVQVGQKIVDRGQIVDHYTFQVLESMYRHEEDNARSSNERSISLMARTGYTLLMVLMLFVYLLQFRRDYLESGRTILLLVSLYLIFPILAFMLVRRSLMTVYVIPFCILPIFVRIFMDSRTAFFAHIVCILTVAVSLRHPFEFIVTQTVAGCTATFTLRQLSQRSELVRTAFFVTAFSLLSYFCLDVLNGCFSTQEGLDRWTYFYLLLAGFLSFLSYVLLIPIERIFGFTSIVTLVELSNTNNPLLRRLSEEAPGTFQHSMQVANLAAEVANKLGAKAQLVRTGALYHDIGKLENPVFFTENQTGKNPHESLSLMNSAKIILDHVQAGVKLAEKYNLPSVITQFIVTHHGKNMARYFYVRYKNDHPEEEIDPEPFSYKGPNPYTLEQAILMMADGVEAASRSLTEYTEESISTMVDNIVDYQVKAGVFNYCPINFMEIAVAKDTLKSKLKTIYHTRIQYPEETPAKSAES